MKPEVYYGLKMDIGRRPDVAGQEYSTMIPLRSRILPASLGVLFLSLVVSGCPSVRQAPDSELDAAQARVEQAPSPRPETPAVQTPGPSAETPVELAKLVKLDTLRDAFNADTHKGRVILLLEPG
ncbi:MAG: hypothetical protein ACPG4T_14940 [Nannocystaceae bacterium]